MIGFLKIMQTYSYRRRGLLTCRRSVPCRRLFRSRHHPPPPRTRLPLLQTFTAFRLCLWGECFSYCVFYDLYVRLPPTQAWPGGRQVWKTESCGRAEGTSAPVRLAGLTHTGALSCPADLRRWGEALHCLEKAHLTGRWPCRSGPLADGTLWGEAWLSRQGRRAG